MTSTYAVNRDQIESDRLRNGRFGNHLHSEPEAPLSPPPLDDYTPTGTGTVPERRPAPNLPEAPKEPLVATTVFTDQWGHKTHVGGQVDIRSAIDALPTSDLRNRRFFRAAVWQSLKEIDQTVDENAHARLKRPRWLKSYIRERERAGHHDEVPGAADKVRELRVAKILATAQQWRQKAHDPAIREYATQEAERLTERAGFIQKGARM